MFLFTCFFSLSYERKANDTFYVYFIMIAQTTNALDYISKSSAEHLQFTRMPIHQLIQFEKIIYFIIKIQ